ncbi:hypothetical protein [Streptomyces sp. S.PNR 29]|uniref:hypothetical protein n=1 Tax=Streptomyces sp. S.PNR 29 TaxID=2973805 RepID=UPI0025B094E5|nr:hypothetical protein [Streptomyces sp. S.PNR 29]MDN0196875.1 hypothetical protein [Streptomyces sp. S.PNR 29]
MAASAYLVLPAPSKPVNSNKPVDPSKPVADSSAQPESPHFCVFSAEGACTEAPLTSEPPHPDAEPLTSEPPLSDAMPLTSEPSVAVPDYSRP